MSARSWIAILLLANYLIVIGIGGMNRPEDQHELVLVQTDAAGQDYQQCRYLRMDGLESFLAEALANRYHNTANVPKHHLLSVIGGIDAHCLSDAFQPILTSVYKLVPMVVTYQLIRPIDVHHSIDAPPWLG